MNPRKLAKDERRVSRHREDLQHPSAGDSLVRQLMARVRSDGYGIGDRLPPMRRLAEMLDVAPHVARDALMQAQSRGLVRIQPRSGVYLQSFNFSSLSEALSDTIDTALAQKDPNLYHLIEARCELEMDTVALAAARRRPEDSLLLKSALQELRDAGDDVQVRTLADEKFHLTIAEVAGNSVMTVMLRALLILLRPYRVAIAPLERSQTWESHLSLFRYITESDPDAARVEMRDHVMLLQRTFLDIAPEASK
jgi:GntR family transcriptional repressor for pyruvate dehydrogenase complex